MLNELIKELQDQARETKNRSASHALEIKVMQGMLNDKDYTVNQYKSRGTEVVQFSPYAEARKELAITLHNAAHISVEEATSIAENYQYSKAEAESKVALSKTFVQTYLETDRTLPLGGRADSNVSLVRKQVPEKIHRKPVTEVVDGVTVHKSIPMDKPTPAHVTYQVKGSCPPWKKN